MINVNELRIGNLFKWSNVASMGQGYDKVTLDNRALSYHKLIDPIPLSHVWLEMAGFEKTKGLSEEHFWFNKHDSKFSPTITYFKGNYFVEDGSEEPVLIAEIKYVHRFQNLYFELTDEELVFNLNSIKSYNDTYN